MCKIIKAHLVIIIVVIIMNALCHISFEPASYCLLVCNVPICNMHTSTPLDLLVYQSYFSQTRLKMERTCQDIFAS